MCHAPFVPRSFPFTNLVYRIIIFAINAGISNFWKHGNMTWTCSAYFVDLTLDSRPFGNTLRTPPYPTSVFVLFVVI
jgi:hypothetical protein